ncbi:MAG: hypothetical protein WBD36_15305 [Bacteroidota bacterium]
MNAQGVSRFQPSEKDVELLRSVEEMVVAAGISPSEFVDTFRTDLGTSADPGRALLNFQRFISAGFTSSLLSDFHQHRVLQTVALELFSQSQYLSDILVRNPELLRWLTASGELKKKKGREDFQAETGLAMAPFERTDRKLDALKRLQRRELLRIGTREILREADIPDVTDELSALADVLVDRIVDLSSRDLLLKAGISVENSFAVIGLGKLGGSELNFSSDIDLLFVYDHDGELEGSAERIRTLHEFFVRLGEMIIRRLSEHTNEGHLYRVDMRLRPDGKSGPLAMSRSTYLNYYEARGELWERQMLLKARVVAGNRPMGEQWLEDLQPFLFPKSLVRSPLEEIASIKAGIERQLEGEQNVKLGAGGIRDIEFIVQAAQLMNGRDQKIIRERNTLLALERLVGTGFMTKQEGQKLSDAYVFLRSVEHRLQLLHGMQTHAIPESEEEATLLARRLGFGSREDFMKELEAQRRAVRKVYDSVFRTRAQATAGRLKTYRKISLSRYGLKREEDARRILVQLKNQIAELESVVPPTVLLNALKKSGSPDRALSNLFRFASAPAVRRTILQALSDKEILHLLILVAARSRNLSQLLSEEPLLFESLVGRPGEVLGTDPGWMFLLDSDPRRFRRFNEFRIALRSFAGRNTIEDASRELSEIAELVFQKACLRVAGEDPGVKIAILALGKFGGKELAFGSDLDVVMLYEGKNGTGADRIFKRILGESKTYNVDVRLRPEGKNAPLASERSYFESYFRSRALLWERQSLLKARVVYGDRMLAADLRSRLASLVFGQPLPKNWTAQILAMRHRMEHERSNRQEGTMDLKTEKGGLVDLEFALQALQLRYGSTHHRMAASNTFEILRTVHRLRLLPGLVARRLEKNYKYIRELEFIVRLDNESGKFVLSRDPESLAEIAASMHERSGVSLLRKVRRMQKENRQLLTTILLRCKE